ncbi:hypothetical protein NB550_11990 [Vibrio parahaemolyticus]|uniref:hypothetical protein n=1 Tax=Vibrio parahaemolyticus TaxID=670 RepID=UPI00215CB9C7|nr:hypothetical protein [Vibrio parahaemolyticus]MCR9888000.1 hypothetical protein [Vibrio parahaemolyticus]MCR9918214.1 hypothetical protein [Vibrio parahaemolyticus]WHT06177.1 hypothetical protein O2T11_24990 [Vibrio parahaemolyticus]
MNKSFPLIICAIVLTGCLPETKVTDKNETKPTPDPTPAAFEVIPYFDYGSVVGGQVYLDLDNDNIAEEDEFYGSTDKNGVFTSSSFSEAVERYPVASVMVKLVKDVTLVKSEVAGDYYIDESKWLSYDLKQLGVSTKSSSVSNTPIHVNALTTWVQALMNSSEEPKTLSEATSLLNDTLKYAEDVQFDEPDYDEYHLKSYINGLEVGAVKSNEFCCVTISIPAFEIVGSKITWSYDEIYERGGEPDPYEPPVFEYDADGDMVIHIPSDPSNPTDPDTGSYEGYYPADGQFALGEGIIASGKTATFQLGNRDNSSSDYGFSVVNGNLAVAYTRKQDGIPSVSELAIDFLGNSVAEEKHHYFKSAGSVRYCNESERAGGQCTTYTQFPGRTRNVLAFNSWGDESIVSFDGPTRGFYSYKNNTWSNWSDTNKVTIWKECVTGREGPVCTPHDSYYNYVDTLFDNAAYGPSGFVNYLKYGTTVDDRLTFRNAIRYQAGSDIRVGSEGDFEMLGGMPVNVMSTFRMRGDTGQYLFGWFNERDDSVRGIAIKKDGVWNALGDNDYDKINSLYSAQYLKPKASITSIEGDVQNFFVGAIELDPQFDRNLNVTGWTLNLRKYETSFGMWSTSWIKFPAEEQIKSMDVTAFNDGSVLGAFCSAEGKMSLLRWSSSLSVPGIGVLEQHDSDEVCEELYFLEASPMSGGKEGIVLVNGPTIYGVSSDGGYIKLVEDNPISGNLKFFSSDEGWVLTGSNKTILLIANDPT